MRIRQFCDAEGQAGKHRNDTFLFDKISNITTQGGTISETSTVPKRNFTIVQGSLVVTEYANAIPYTQKFETLSEISVPESIKVTLRNDMGKALDSAAAAQFKTTKWKVTVNATDASFFETDGVMGTTQTGNLSDHTTRDIVDELKKLNVPRRKNGEYVCIGSTQALRGLYDYFEQKAYYAGDLKPIYAGEVGSYYACRFIEETNVLSNTLGQNSTSGEALFFGGDAVREGIVIPEEIRMDLAKDFGRDQAIAWFYLGGFKKVWDYSSDSESHIIHLTSA